jgi:hypothetical protein
MRHPILLAAALAVLSAPCLALTNAPVTSVTLYPGSATVTRTAQLAAGASEVVIGGLPANFNAETLRVQAGPGIRIGEVVTLDAAASHALNPAEAALAARIEAHMDQKALLEAEAKSAHIVRAYLERFNTGADKPGSAVDGKALAGLISTLGKGASDALVKIQKLAVQDRGFDTQFEVPGRVSLASDGREVTVGLSSQTLAVRQHLRVTPRLEKFGIIMAEAARPDGVWPAGNMQLFRDGSYIGATHWNLQDGKRAEFAFGRDDLLKVSVDAVDGMAGSKGLFGGRATRNTADVFTLVNRHKTAMDVIVIESSPVAASEEIKVQATFAPPPAVDAWEQRRGVVAWKKKMAPGETSKFNVEYRIDYPKEGQLLGLR